MLEINEIDPASRSDVAAFIKLPFRLYAGTPQWVPPLDFEARGLFDRRRHPFYRENEAAFFLARQTNGQVVGRLAILNNKRYNQFNDENTAFFYLFECEQDTATAQELFKAATEWAKARGLTYLTGPKGFTVFDGMGMLVNGFEHRPAFGLPYNLRYYPELVENAGFHNSGEMVSGHLDVSAPFPEKFHQLAELLKQRRALTVASYRTRSELRALVPRLKELYNSSLDGTSGNVPITEEEAAALANQMMWFANPRLIKIILKAEQPVGFLFAYPDISEALQKIQGKVFPFGWITLLREFRKTKWININGAGMAEGYRGLGGTALLFSEMYKSVAQEGYLHADLVQIGIDNDRMLRELRSLGVDFYKTHRMYSKFLED